MNLYIKYLEHDELIINMISLVNGEHIAKLTEAFIAQNTLKIRACDPLPPQPD